MQRFLLLLLTLALSGALHAQELRIALGVQDNSARNPQSQTGGLASFNEDLARELCRRMSARCTTANVFFADILPGVESGQYDLGFGNYLRTAEREMRVAFSDPIWRSSSRLVARSATAKRLARQHGANLNLDSLRDARLTVIQETQQDKFLQTIAGEHQLSVLGTKTMADMMQALKEGQADLALMPMLSAYTLLIRESAGQFEFVGPPITEHGLGGTVHIALPKGEEALRLKVNRAIAAIRADGSYHRITRQYFPFSLD